MEKRKMFKWFRSRNRNFVYLVYDRKRLFDRKYIKNRNLEIRNVVRNCNIGRIKVVIV